ncbi:hypothetical protein HRI_004755100 [Hibiscus trionum]|uniref:Uncharacterized protein n=1 Tax=Hibiscus trionum TaxID=183268 RepID=A0A9W7JFU5_HIBTR|nr:hypothetical protein HRI_004755100 [Hibiscus trionum]
MPMNKPSFLHLCFSLLLLFFGLCSVCANGIGTNTRHTLSNRKLLPTKFNFTPFLHHHLRYSSVDVDVQRPEPSGNDIDPRYGVEKRLVPTGPNPLHH